MLTSAVDYTSQEQVMLRALFEVHHGVGKGDAWNIVRRAYDRMARSLQKKYPGPETARFISEMDHRRVAVAAALEEVIRGGEIPAVLPPVVGQIKVQVFPRTDGAV